MWVGDLRGRVVVLTTIVGSADAVLDCTVVNVALPRRGRRLCHEAASLLALAVFRVINMVTFAILTGFSGAVPFRMLFHQVANGS